MRISDWSSDVCSSDLRDVAEKIYAAPVSPTAGDGPMQGQLLDPMVTIRSARRVASPPLAEAPKGCVVNAESAAPGDAPQPPAALPRTSILYFAFLRALAIPPACLTPPLPAPPPACTPPDHKNVATGKA